MMIRVLALFVLWSTSD